GEERERSERRVGDGWELLPVRLEGAVAEIKKPDLLLAHRALRHEVALLRVRPRDQQVDPLGHRGRRRLAERDLLPHDRRHVAVEREDEGLCGPHEIEPLLAGREDERAMKAEDGVEAAVREQAEAADLIAHKSVVIGRDRREEGEAEAANLLINVTK